MKPKRADTAGSDGKTSQVRAQYDALKRQHPGRILLFQLGDFYETFEADARTVARVCDITLTSRELSKGDRVDLAGVPVARAAPHIGKLISAGLHVAICDQVSEPGKGLVERAVTRIVTPGTVAEPGLVAPHENNLIVALAQGRGGIGLAAADVTTGELTTTVLAIPSGPRPSDADRAAVAALLATELQRLAPAECLTVEAAAFPCTLPGHTTTLPASRFDPSAAADAVKRLFHVSALDGYGLPAESPALAALGALVAYVGEVNHRLLASLREPRPYVVGSHLALDPTTRRNLDVLRTARDGQQRGSLFHAIDRTRTPMGARRLRRLLGQPLVERAVLDARLDAVAALAHDGQQRSQLRALLGRLGDVERLIGRVRQTAATPREVVILALALRLLPEIQAALPADGDLLQRLGGMIDGCPSLAETIEATLAEPGGARMIRAGHSAELDELVDGMTESRRWLAQLERRERERTSIRSLRVGYNKVFGYYLEVTRPNLPNVPPEYSRRQSLVSAERFVTPELKEREALILTAEAQIDELETALFQALLRKVAEQAAPILRSVEAVADLDVLAGLADVAADRGWTRPELTAGDALEIAGGRHPILEAMRPGGDIVPNDCRLAASLSSASDNRVPDGIGGDAGTPDAVAEAGRLLIVTGPNMGGKSTYLRMVALTVLLAQIGSFVPAEAARIGLADRLFTRVGSEDDLTVGASTFLVEMAETASILRQATPRSLVVLDEVGRGTSTHDGMCIAQAVLEHLHDEVGARTLFATHFHELTALADTRAAVRNVTVAVDERDGQLSFLYRVVPGAADRSYGVQVARLAGLLASVTERAASLLSDREREADDLFVPFGALDVDPRPLVLGTPDRASTPQTVPAAVPESSPHLPSTPLPPGLMLPRADEEGTGRREDRLHWDAYHQQQPSLHVAEAPNEYVATPARLVPPNGSHDAEAETPRADPPAPIRTREDGGRGALSGQDVPPAGLTVALGAESASVELEGDGHPAATGDVAARLLADVLALDLGNLTPIKALTLLHEMQQAARQAVPWNAWVAGLAGARRADPGA